MKRKSNFQRSAWRFLLPAVLFSLSLNVTAQYKYIISHPRDVTVDEKYPDPVVFSVDLLPDTKADIQWFYYPSGSTTPEAIKGAIYPVLEMTIPEAIDRKLVNVPIFCELAGADWKETSLSAYLYIVNPRLVITKHPEDVIKEEGFVGEIYYGVDLLPGTEAKIYWYIRFPGEDWREYGTGQQITFPIKEPLTDKFLGTAFRCEVEYKGGLDVSNTAYLWIKYKKKYIVLEPVDVTKTEGFVGEIYFNIKTEGLGLGYQWQIQYPGDIWKDLLGAEKPELVFPIKEPLSMKLDGTAFRCVVRDEKGYTENSEPAYLHVEQGRKYILLDPQDVTEKQGFVGELFFAIKYDDPIPLRFQWQIKEPGGSVWKDILEAAKPTLYYPIKVPLTPDWSGTAFRCVVSDEKGYVEYSNPAYLYVTLYETYILGHPKNVTQCEGYAGNISFRIKPVPDVKLTFQWQLLRPDESKWTDIPGTDAIDYTQSFEELPLSYNKYSYRCKVTDEYGGVEFSNVAFLYVNAKPQITTHPISQTKLLGEAVTFNVSASGYKPLSYQWQKDDVNLAGATSNSYSIAPIAIDDSGYYRCVVSNTCLPSGVASNAAKLTVDVPKYTDGWFSQDIVTSNNLTDIKFAEEFSGWVTELNSPNIYKTDNGGDDWNVISLSISGNWRAVFTTDANHVWAAGDEIVRFSVNGGSNWTTYSLDSIPVLLTTIDLYDLYFVDQSEGWAVGDNGLIINTTDGGQHWSVQNSGDIPPFVVNSNLQALHFINPDTGWVVGANSKIFKTLNGGSSWSSQTSPVALKLLKDVFFIDEQNGWIAGNDNTLLKTTNGGTSWTSVSTPASVAGVALNGVHFADLLNGWVVAGNGIILRTNDGGTSWYSQASGTDQPLNAIDFADYNNGWVVGDVGTILRTAYSGCILPTVGLYEDKAFCASVNYELVADSFAKNIDCSYLWSTEEETGSIMVTESGTYYVTVTSVCGKEVSDTVHIELYPLPVPDAGNDAEICNGDSIQLLATGGVVYSWNNELYLDDPDVQNPKAGPPVGINEFIVTVTDDNECQNTDTVAITVYPVPTSTFSAPDYICGTGIADIIYTGSASAYGNFYWDFDEGSTIHSGDSIGPYEVSWDTAGIRTISLVAEENGCSSDTTFHTVSVNVIPLSDFEMVGRVCGDDQVTVTYEGAATTGANYNWSFGGGTTVSGTGQGPYEISWATGGNKTVSLAVTEDNCTSPTTSNQVTVAYPYNDEDICLVSVDIETGKNMVIFEKTPGAGIASYNIYRESDVSGVYSVIGLIHTDSLSVFVDQGSNPEEQQYLYKISAIDTCGNESDLSPFHKTLFLQFVSSVGGVNLRWDKYEIQGEPVDFASYVIYRGSDSSQLSQVKIISGSLNSWTDTDPVVLTAKYYYRIAGVKGDTCDPAGLLNKKAGTGPYSHSLSNLEDNRLQTSGVKDLLGSKYRFNVYPNPFRQETSITYSLNESANVKIEIFNLLGARVADIVNEIQSPGEFTYVLTAADIGSTEGIFYMRFTVNGQSMVKKLILAR